MPEFTLRSAQFRREREPSWRRLEALVTRVEAGGLGSLTAEEIAELPSLYRGVVSSLSVASAISLDRNLNEYLTALAGRAYVCVYGTKQRASLTVGEFFVRRWPEAVRRHAGFVATSILLLVLGTLAGFLLTSADPERFYSFVSEQMAAGRAPAASTEELRDVLYDRGEGFLGELAVFATFLFTHNSKVAIMSFALGFAAGAPVVLLVFYNGLLLGAMAALYASRGLGGEFWAWVLPHGVTELLAICLCGAAGLVLGSALVFPGRHRRLENLALRGREVAVLVIGAVCMLFVAGLIEGVFRQLVTSETMRWLVAASTLLFWCWYFGTVGRSRGGA